MPQLSITVGILLAIASVGVLIYFIHHASTSIQASQVITRVSVDLHHAINRLFPEKLGHSVPESQRQVGEIPVSFDSEADSVRAAGSGYLQEVDLEPQAAVISRKLITSG